MKRCWVRRTRSGRRCRVVEGMLRKGAAQQWFCATASLKTRLRGRSEASMWPHAMWTRNPSGGGGGRRRVKRTYLDLIIFEGNTSVRYMENVFHTDFTRKILHSGSIGSSLPTLADCERSTQNVMKSSALFWCSFARNVNRGVQLETAHSAFSVGGNFQPGNNFGRIKPLHSLSCPLRGTTSYLNDVRAELLSAHFLSAAPVAESEG